MTLIVAGRLIQKHADLSELARLSLMFIDGATEWITWAISSPMSRYDLPDEVALVAAVQQGLHASPLTLLPRLGIWISPVKLMSLGADHLRALGRAETDDASDVVKEKLQSMLAELNIVPAEKLRGVTTFLQKLGVESAPLFLVREFNDLLALVELEGLRFGQPGPRQEALCREAASWAVEQARTVPEFCDYYQVYLAHASNMLALEASADTRKALADRVLEKLLPLTFGTIDGPRLRDRLVSPAEVERALHAWLAQGKKLGFGRPSQVVLQFVTHAGYTDEMGDDAPRILLERYLARAQTFLASRSSWKSHLEQDGATTIFTLTSGMAGSSADDSVAQLQVSRDGVLSLRRFGTYVNVNGVDTLRGMT
jgi:hypothetical protein